MGVLMYFQKKFQIATVSLSVSKKFKKSAKFNYSDRGVSTIATPLENKQRHVGIGNSDMSQITRHYVI